MTKLSYFEKAHLSNIDFRKREKDLSRILIFIYILGIFISFLILTIRLFHLTVVKGSYYRRLSEENRIRELIIEAKRGKIIDRKGFVIAENKPADIKFNKERIFSNRVYSDGEAYSQILGYRQTADKEDFKNDPCLNKLKLGDKVGKKGIEKIYECSLRGRSGKKLIEVDAHGKYLRTLSIAPPEDGQTIQLALDSQLQKKAYALIKDKKAAIVALKPKTGEVLLLLSSPSFDPQLFEDSNGQVTSKYFTDQNKPLFNRATQGTYPPGSAFKPFIAAAALEEKKIDKKTLIEDTGIVKAGPLTFGNWYFLQYGKTDSEVNVVKALQRSNDIFFYKISELLEPEKIKNWAGKFGFGGLTNIELDEEEGLIPSPFWKKETLNERWYLGDTYNLSIGQGYLLATPLQLARATAAFANNGYLCKPLLTKIGTGSCKKINISQQTLDLIKEGMTKACQTGGTGWPFFDFPIKVACKTGTAESHGGDSKPHAWFTVYAPVDSPEIAVTVLIEEAGQGSDIAAPIAKEILKSYFERKE